MNSWQLKWSLKLDKLRQGIVLLICMTLPFFIPYYGFVLSLSLSIHKIAIIFCPGAKFERNLSPADIIIFFLFLLGSRGVIRFSYTQSDAIEVRSAFKHSQLSV